MPLPGLVLPSPSFHPKQQSDDGQDLKLPSMSLGHVSGRLRAGMGAGSRRNVSSVASLAPATPASETPSNKPSAGMPQWKQTVLRVMNNRCVHAQWQRGSSLISVVGAQSCTPPGMMRWTLHVLGLVLHPATSS